MKPQKQLFRHRPQDGVYGDCHRTAIAIVLDMEAADVPHFFAHSEAWAASDGARQAAGVAEAWLNERGLMTVNLIFSGEVPVKEVLRTIVVCNPNSRPVFVLGGRSKNGVNHSVVCCDGEIACDPGQDDPGIVGPCDDGFYWVTFFGALVATNKAAKAEAVA